jgi:hypothetical protein
MRGSHIGDYEKHCLQGCDAVWCEEIYQPAASNFWLENYCKHGRQQAPNVGINYQNSAQVQCFETIERGDNA